MRPPSGGGSKSVGAGDAGEGGATGGAGGERGDNGGGIGAIGHIGGFSGEPGWGGAPVIVPPECEQEAEWQSPVPLDGLNTPDGDERLLAVTPDELSLLFLRDGELFVADRDSTADTFDTPIAVTVPDGYDATRGAALSPDGLRLVLARSGGSGFGELTRAARLTEFGESVDPGPFAAINYDAAFWGSKLSSPALGAGDDTFYYNDVTGDSFVHLARWTNDGWEIGKRIDPYTLGGTSDAAKLVTGIAPDELTIFVFDEALGYVTAFWRDTPIAPFYTPVALEGLLAAQTVGDCARLYASVQGEASTDVATLDR